MKNLTLSLTSRLRSKIVVGRGSLDKALYKDFSSRKAFIVVDEALAAVGCRLGARLRRSGFTVKTFAVAAGEALKDFREIYPLYGELLDAGADRRSTIFAVGGGSVGDAVGFVAATYLRGVPWVGVPTTLLSQVDSAVGGKTGVNHARGKNLLGAFHQPRLVIVDPELLRGLSVRDMWSGLAEILKIGIALDAKHFRFLEKSLENLLDPTGAPLAQAIATSLAWKIRIVARDEFDLTGERERLNFGHTLGHALESAAPRGYFRHGEAVLLGMRAAAFIAHAHGILPAKDFTRIDALCRRVPVPRIPVKLSNRAILAKLRFDKKRRDGVLHFVLPTRVGACASVSGIPATRVLAALENLR